MQHHHTTTWSINLWPAIPHMDYCHSWLCHSLENWQIWPFFLCQCTKESGTRAGFNIANYGRDVWKSRPAVIAWNHVPVASHMPRALNVTASASAFKYSDEWQWYDICTCMYVSRWAVLHNDKNEVQLWCGFTGANGRFKSKAFFVTFVWMILGNKVIVIG